MRPKTLPCTEEEEETLLYFIIIYNLASTHYHTQPLSFSFPKLMAAHGVGVAQAKPARKHTIATRKCYQCNTPSGSGNCWGLPGRRLKICLCPGAGCNIDSPKLWNTVILLVKCLMPNLLDTIIITGSANVRIRISLAFLSSQFGLAFTFKGINSSSSYVRFIMYINKA